MSYQATVWAATIRTGSPTLKALLLAVANYTDEDGVCFPKQITLAYDTEMSKRSVQRGLEKLRDLGIIEIAERFQDDGGQTSNLLRLVDFIPPRQIVVRERKPGPTPLDTTVANSPRQQVANQEQLSNSQSNSKSAARPPSGTRIPDDWELTPDLGNYGRSKGLTRNEVIAEAEKFKDYWRSAAGAKARKMDWDATWRGWIQRSAERLGRKPMVDSMAPPEKIELDRQTWENLAKIYANSSNWHRDWGPEPGHPRCRMPPDLQQQFASQH